MSYDVWLTIDTGGPKPAQVGRDFNLYGSTVSACRRAGADVADFAGKLAGDCVPALGRAIADMEANPGRYQAAMPDSYEACLYDLRDLRDVFAENLKATVEVSR